MTLPNLGPPNWPTPRVFKRPEKLRRCNWQLWRWGEIWENGHRCLTRLTVIRTPWFRVMVHWWDRGEGAMVLHNHWSWLASFVVRGSYLEERSKRTGPVRARVVSQFNWLGRDDFHRVTEVEDNTLTICLTGGHRKDPEHRQL